MELGWEMVNKRIPSRMVVFLGVLFIFGTTLDTDDKLLYYAHVSKHILCKYGSARFRL